MPDKLLLNVFLALLALELSLKLIASFLIRHTRLHQLLSLPLIRDIRLFNIPLLQIMQILQRHIDPPVMISPRKTLYRLLIVLFGRGEAFLVFFPDRIDASEQVVGQAEAPFGPVVLVVLSCFFQVRFDAVEGFFMQLVLIFETLSESKQGCEAPEVA